MKVFSLRRDRLLFATLLVFEICHLFYLVLSHRMPLGHDGFQYFSLQYFFLNDSAMNGEVPLWIPYVNHGITATWWYTIQGTVGILANALFLAGRSIASVNFLDIFHYGIFVDRLLLLTGVWLLGQRYFDSAFTRFFVASCIMGSTVTMTQFKFTLHLYYAIPLLLYLGHAFLDTGRFRFFFLACNLFMVQMIGNDAYFFPIITLTLFLYFLFYALDDLPRFSRQINNLRFGLPGAAGITGGLLSLALLAVLFTAGKDPALVNLNFGRNLDGSTPLNIFLTYAGNMNFSKWQELLLRVSPALDFTIYMGFISLPLVFLGIFNDRSRIKNPLLLVILILLFFSMGTWISVFFYYVWPTMKFYRHLALITPVIKLLLLFLAGFGFEKIFIHRETWEKHKLISYFCLTAGVLLLQLSIILSQLSTHGQQASHYIMNILTRLLSLTPAIFDTYAVRERLCEASLYSMLAGFIFILLPLIPFKKYGHTLVLAVLIINAGDIYGYYCTEINDRTFALNNDQYKITAFTPTPYAPRRVIDAANPRKKILTSPLLRPGYLYTTTNAFLLQDALATRYRTDERLKPLQELISVFGKGLFTNHVFLNIAGSTDDKIQFFNKDCFAGDNKQMASYLSNSIYKGDVLLVSGRSANLEPVCNGQKVLSSNDRIHVPYQIMQFTPNVLALSINVPYKKPVWMMYADGWHQGWKAEINGNATAVLKANLAYKAIQIPPGKNIVRFEFHAPGIEFLEKTMAVNSLLWLFILMYLVVGIFRCSPADLLNVRSEV